MSHTIPVPQTLGRMQVGEEGVIERLSPDAMQNMGTPFDELERRMIGMGFVEGARVKLIHEAPMSKDPIVVLLDETRVALRRNEANAVWVKRP